MELKNAILSDEQIKIIGNRALDDLTPDAISDLYMSIAESIKELIPPDTSVVERILFTARFVYIHGFMNGLTLMNDAIKSFI